jgi:L-aminopeptidase/D-esterase-like protein
MALGHPDVLVGTWTDVEHDTGLSVVLPPPGTMGACIVRGAAPGTREAAALGPTGRVEECHAIVLTGGSAFGLAAADGVARWCHAHGRGYDVVVTRVPIVGAAVVFDLTEDVHPPDAKAGWLACEEATSDDPPQGCHGVGRGCTVGKLAGRAHGTKGGQGWSVARAGEVSVGALVAVNCFGEVLDEDGRVLAGSLAPPMAPRFPVTPLEEVAAWSSGAESHMNTTIGCLVSNARLSKAEACRAADLSHTGIARAVEPPHTNADGDALFLLCTGEVEASADLVAHLGTAAVSAAIRSAVRHACATAGRPRDPRSGPPPRSMRCD